MRASFEELGLNSKEWTLQETQTVHSLPTLLPAAELQPIRHGLRPFLSNRLLSWHDCARRVDAHGIANNPSIAFANTRLKKPMKSSTLLSGATFLISRKSLGTYFFRFSFTRRWRPTKATLLFPMCLII